MVRSTVVSIALCFASAIVVPAQDHQGHAVPAKRAAAFAVGQPVPLSFVHVDNAGAIGDSLAAAIEKQFAGLPMVVRQDEADLVVWLRTIDFASDGVPIVAYSVIVDYDGRHVTDNLGLTSADRVTDAAVGLASLISRLSSELRATGTLAALE